MRFIFVIFLLLLSIFFPSSIITISTPTNGIITSDVDLVKEEGLTCLLHAQNDISFTYSLSSENLTNLLNEGIDQSIDVNTLLLQYYHLKKDARKKIDNCKLNLKPAQSRCNSVYESLDYNLKCESMVINGQPAPFVTLECPSGYERNGCCRCSRQCDSEGLVEEVNKTGNTDKNHCVKRKSYETNPISRKKYYENYSKQPVSDRMEGYGNYYIEKCKEGFTRVGLTRCIAHCPLGWPDLGDRCHKTGDIVIMPFIWTVGDGQIKEEKI